MKITSKYLTTALFICLFNMVAIAGNMSVFSIAVADENSFVIQLTNVEEAEISIKIIDIQGIVLYDETLIETGLNQKKYDLHELPIGNYTLVVGYDNVVRIQPVRKEFAGLEINTQEMQTIFKPTFRQHAAYLDLDMLCLSDLDVMLKIVDAEGNVIYKELREQSKSINKRFDLSSLEKGSYSFVVKIINAGFYKEFTEFVNWSPSSLALKK